jgi:hypothetical protein
MTSSTKAPLQSYFTCKQPRDNHSPQYRLQWRQGQLLVRLAQDVKQPYLPSLSYLPSLENDQWLVSCLKQSPVELVCVDAALGEAELQRWADACEQANKPVFLRGAIAKKMPKPRQSGLSRRDKRLIALSWWVKRLIDWMAALLLLIVLSPVMLVVVALMYVYSRGEIFSRRWHVGARGKLFRIFRFRTKAVTVDDPRTTPLGRWMCRYSLDELPRLFNVLRGEMSLLGPRPWSLHDVMRFSPEAMTSDCATRVSAGRSLVEFGGTIDFLQKSSFSGRGVSSRGSEERASAFA